MVTHGLSQTHNKCKGRRIQSKSPSRASLFVYKSKFYSIVETGSGEAECFSIITHSPRNSVFHLCPRELSTYIIQFSVLRWPGKNFVPFMSITYRSLLTFGEIYEIQFEATIYWASRTSECEILWWPKNKSQNSRELWLTGYKVSTRDQLPGFLGPTCSPKTTQQVFRFKKGMHKIHMVYGST